MTFLTFTIGKFKSSKFQNCPSETEILQSYFKITNNKTESQLSTSQVNESECRWMILPRKMNVADTYLLWRKQTNCLACARRRHKIKTHLSVSSSALNLKSYFLSFHPFNNSRFKCSHSFVDRLLIISWTIKQLFSVKNIWANGVIHQLNWKSYKRLYTSQLFVRC